MTPTPIRWLWLARIALGKLTLFAGDPGLGKSMIGTDMAARLSAGVGWPDLRDETIERGGVVLLSAEDDVDDTICPRLHAAGADLSKIVAIQGVEFCDPQTGKPRARSFNLERDLPALEDAIRQVGDCRLVVVDPISAFCGKVNTHRMSDVRGILAPLSELANRHGVAVVGITHLNKAYGGKAMYRTTGSLGFTAAARSAWLIVADKDDPGRRLMLCVKSNLARMPSGLAYQIDSKSIEAIEDIPYLLWDAEPVTMTANEALAAEARQERDRGKGRAEASAEWLREQLVHGPLPTREVENRARDAGMSWASVRRAQQRLGIKPRKAGFGEGWLWELPDEGAQDAEDAQDDGLSAFGESQHLGDPKTAFSIAPAEGVQDAHSKGLSTFDSGDDWGEL